MTQTGTSMLKAHRTFKPSTVAGRVCRVVARTVAIVLAVAVIALMYQGERYTLQQPSATSDPSLLASCAIGVVGQTADTGCITAPIHSN